MRFSSRTVLSVAVLFLAVGARAETASPTNAPASFQEVYQIIRQHLDAVTDAELQQAAIAGLVEQLEPRVQLISATADGETEAATNAPFRMTIYPGPIACFQVTNVNAALPNTLDAAIREVTATTNLQGIVLDLRFANGEDYAAAGAVADLFVGSERLLLDWGSGTARSTTKTNPVKFTLAVLINKQTAAAAEALAAVLRETGVGLLLGTNTAGRAMILDEFTLQNGQLLRVAKSGVRLGSGEALAAAGVAPDIAVAVGPESELIYWSNPYVELAVGGRAGAGTTNRPPRRQLNEAELVREHRGGTTSTAEEQESAAIEPESPLVRDPAMARALDLIKGLAVVRQLRSK